MKDLWLSVLNKPIFLIHSSAVEGNEIRHCGIKIKLAISAILIAQQYGESILENFFPIGSKILAKTVLRFQIEAIN